MSGELKEICGRLSLREKVELRECLTDMITATLAKPRSPLRCSMLLGDMAKVMGRESIGYFSREAGEVWARTMVAFQMCKEGYTTTEIGRQMEKDHSTITHLKNKMRDALSLPQAYGDIIEIWNRFQKQIDNDIHKGTTENTVSLGGEFPDCGKGAMGKESGQIRTQGDL